MKPNKQNTNTDQTSKIFAYLKKNKVITPLDALNKFGCFRLSARIYEIRQNGYDVEMTLKFKGKKKWSEYRLCTK